MALRGFRDLADTIGGAGCLVTFNFTVTASGTAVSGATVILYDPNGFQIGSGATNGSGLLTLYGYAPGTYRYRVTASGDVDSVSTVAASCGSTNAVAVAMVGNTVLISGCPCSTGAGLPTTMLFNAHGLVSGGHTIHNTTFNYNTIAGGGGIWFVSQDVWTDGIWGASNYQYVLECATFGSFELRMRVCVAGSFGSFIDGGLFLRWNSGDAANVCSPFAFLKARDGNFNVITPSPTLLP